MPSPHLNIEHVADTAQKAPVVNEQTDLLDRAMNQHVIIDVSAGGQIVVTAAQAQENMLLRLTGTPAADFEIIMPAEQRFFGVHNQVSSGRNCTVGVDVTAGTWDVVQPLERALFHCDGENAIKLATTALGVPSGLVEQFIGMIEIPQEKTYTLDQSAAYEYNIDTLIGETALGELDITIEIDGVPVTGINGVTFNITEATATASAGQLVAVGAKVTMIVSDLETATTEDFAFTMKVTRTG